MTTLSDKVIKICFKEKKPMEFIPVDDFKKYYRTLKKEFRGELALFTPTYIHSVLDEYTGEKLKK